MKIFFSPFSPYVRKCLATAVENGLDAKIELVDCAAHPVQRDPSIIVSNPLGKIPVLVLDNGSALYDSRVICEYLDDAGQKKLFPKGGPARWQALTLQSLADGMLDAAILARYEANVRPEPLRWADWSAGQMDKIRTSFLALEKDAAALADRVDIGTITLGCALWYLDVRFADLGWRKQYPVLGEWQAEFAKRDSMKREWKLPG